MYTLRPFMRLNTARGPEIEQFVKALTNQHLSVREIELLAQGYFRGPASLREAIDTGKLSWSLEQMQKVPQDSDGCHAHVARHGEGRRIASGRLEDTSSGSDTDVSSGGASREGIDCVRASRQASRS